MITLPTTPQSLRKIFSNSIKIYLKFFLVILPVCATWSALSGLNWIFQPGIINQYKTKYPFDYVINYLSNLDQLWINLCHVLTSILFYICICWAICFIYKLISSGKIYYKSSLVTALRKFFVVVCPIILLLGMTILLTVLTMLGGVHVYNFLLPLIYSSILQIVFGILSIVLFMVFLYYSVHLVGVYWLEILAKNTRFFPAIKKAINIVFSIKAMPRLISIFLLFLPLCVVCMTIALVLYNFDLYSSITQHWIIPLMLFFVFLMSLVIFPFGFIVYVSFYNDLISRFDN